MAASYLFVEDIAAGTGLSARQVRDLARRCRWPMMKVRVKSTGRPRHAYRSTEVLRDLTPPR